MYTELSAQGEILLVSKFFEKCTLAFALFTLCILLICSSLESFRFSGELKTIREKLYHES